MKITILIISLALLTGAAAKKHYRKSSFKEKKVITVTDIDGNIYPYITICGRSWMTTNLKVTHFRNGDSLINGLTGINWASNCKKTDLPAYAFPNNDAANKDSFGLYYNAAAIADDRGIAPKGWHVATDDEWKALEVCLGMSKSDADSALCRGNIGKKLLTGGSSGLNIQLAGYLLPISPPSYVFFNQQGAYWTSTPRFATYQTRGFNVCDMKSVYRSIGSSLFSVRCVKD